MKAPVQTRSAKACLQTLALLAGIFLAPAAGAQTTTWISPFPASWGDSANWSNGLPAAGVETIINSNGNGVFLDAPTTAESGDLYLGQTGSPFLFINGGNLTTTGNAYIGAANGASGTVTMFSGSWSINGPGSELYVGFDGGDGSIYLGGGTLEARQIKTTGFSAFEFDRGTLRLLEAQPDLFSGFGNGEVTISGGGGTIDTNGFDVALDDGMVGTGRFTKSGAGTLSLTGANTYNGGTTISAGTLRLGDGGSIVGNVSNDGTIAFARTDDFTFDGIISGTGGVVLESGILRLTNIQDYTGPTDILGGYFVLPTGPSDAISSQSVVTLAAGAFLDISNRFQFFTLQGEGAVYSFGGANGRLTLNGESGVTREFSGTIGSDHPNFDVHKAGSGTMILSGANNYTGETRVYGGTLLVNNTVGSGTGTGSVSVDDGGTLGGSGRIGGDLTFEAGALFAFAPSNTLTLDGTLTIDITFGVASLRDLTGDALDWTSIADGAYSIIEGDLPTFSPANISNFGFANAFDIGGGRFAYFDNGSVPNTSLDLIVVPEPATLLLLGLGLLAAAALRRRWRSASGGGWKGAIFGGRRACRRCGTGFAPGSKFAPGPSLHG